MAIQKAKAVSSSVSGNYWVTNIVQVSPDYTQSRAHIQLFKSAAAFLSGDPALFTSEYILTGSENPLMFKDLVELVETKLVTLSGDVNGGSVV